MPGPHVITLVDGTTLRGRGLRHALPDGPVPEFGLYLVGKPPPATGWPARWLRWPDFWLPRDRADAIDAFAEAHVRAASERVEIACGGGRGRTGTALACIAILAGTPADQAVEYVRTHYDRKAVETPWQRRYVRQFTA
jgi:hypothetical protein